MNSANLKTDGGSYWNPFRLFSSRRQTAPIVCSPAEFTSVQPVPGLQPKTVLIVDDDPVVRTALSNVLRREGHTPLAAGDCAEAIALVGENSPDLILLDLSFPPDVANGGMTSWDGFQLMLWLRGLNNADHSKFVVVTGSDTPEVRKKAKGLGAIAVLGKPVDCSELLELIRGRQRDRIPARR
jgi:CheY-like chemotaxis protein